MLNQHKKSWVKRAFLMVLNPLTLDLREIWFFYNEMG